MARPPGSTQGRDETVPAPAKPEKDLETYETAAPPPPEPGTLTEGLAAVAEEQDLALAVAKARIAANLLGRKGSRVVGRYEVSDVPLGSGGMGTIYPGTDKELHRTVALKFLHLPGREEVALGEARALAKLAHPNVVPIFDIGRDPERDEVYIVMEMVRGETLRQWVRNKPRTRREILAAYRQAGKALAAAHAEGLVHRDFKPDNAIMGFDGRLRVVDFGLACAAADDLAASHGRQAVAGTPRYMAPEQSIGQPVTPAADQFSFCTALAEALKEAAEEKQGVPLPRWIQTAIDRGHDPMPSDRFPSMQELLRALADDPAVKRRWRRIGAAVAGVAVVALVAAFVAGRRMSARDPGCDTGAQRLASVWGDAGGPAAALDRIATLSAYGRSLRPRLEKQFGDHAKGWASGYRDACLARGRSQSEALVDRRMACLERGRAALESVARIVGTVDAQMLPSVVKAVTELPDPNMCNDLEALLAGVEPPPPAISMRVGQLRGQLEDARIQIAAGRFTPARALAEKTVADARSLGYRPVLAEALLAEGYAIMQTDDRAAAIPLLTEAYTVAFESGLQSVAVEAWARRAWTQGTVQGEEASLSGLDVVEAVAAQKGTTHFARALLYNNVGGIELALERRDRARTAFERAAREAAYVVGEGAAELLIVQVSLALTTDDPERRDALLAEAETNTAKLLGADHPDTLDRRWTRGMTLVPFAKAIDLLAPTCAALQDYTAFKAALCWAELGFLRREMSDDAGAIEAFQRGASLRVEAGSSVPALLPYLHLWRGQASGAVAEIEELLEARPARKDEPWWDRLERADLELALARAQRAAGGSRDAKRTLTVAIEALADVARRHPAATVDRRLGRARAEMAKVLVALGAPRREVAGYAAPAAAWLRQAGGPESEIAGLERLSGVAPGPADQGGSQ